MQVGWARTGGEAIVRLRRDRWDYVVCDIRLPDMDGEEIYSAAMPELGGTPIIFMTAFGDIEQAVRLMRAGADDYLIKPFSIETLRSEEHTSELQSLMRISYAVLFLTKKHKLT